MSFDWSDYLSLAESLSQHPEAPGPEEAALRAAISRAYYAAYCTARNFAHSRGEITLTRTAGDHQLVIGHFKGSEDRGKKSIGLWLDRLRDNRNSADYDDTLTGNPRSQAQSSIAQARNVLTKLNTL
jgi:uncharacterized protein (UPF0332 family)